ncbi:MAG: integrase family protein [Paracoccaceae bacterium]|nr:MAG: integrase family protein [Paracoccaceae bacterium]
MRQAARKATTFSKTAKIGAATRHSALPDGALELLIRDKDLTGFALRVRRESARYVMEGRVAGTGIRRKITIGDAATMSASEARDRAMSIRNQMRAGDDPVKLHTVAPQIFGDIAAEFQGRWVAGKIGRKAPRPASIAGMTTDLKRALNNFASTRINEIDAKAIRSFRAKLLAEDVSPAVKRRAFGALTMVMAYAQDVGHIADNPAASFTLPAASVPRERYLSPEELAAAWSACSALGRPGDAVRFLIAMPVRLSEVRLMTWTWIDMAAKTLTIPATAKGNKAAETFILPLCDMAVDILARQPTRDGLVFRGRQGGPVSLGSDVKDRLDALSGVTEWRFHDLRRTVVTLLADADHEIDVDACDRWLQHKRTGIKAVYQRASRRCAKSRQAGT